MDTPFNKLTIIWLLLLLSCGCSGGPAKSHSVTVAGSTSVQPFAEKLAEIFMEVHPDTIVNVQGGGSTAGIKACVQRAAQIGTCSRELKREESNLERIVIAHDGIAVIVHPRNPVKNLTIEQLQGIFSGKIRSWALLGWIDKPIFFVTREEGSGTRDAFEHLVMGKLDISDEALVQDSNGSVREIIANNTWAIGYISFGVVNKQVKALAVNSVLPSPKTIKSKQYKLTRPFLFVTLPQPSELSQKFIDFVLGPDGQRILEHEGLIGVH
ncbi:MAG: phosphate ABC transporter substrate-binding protein [Deltaproteobacteria bacterium]|nr:phosphate ABC transporter substrate-binding protein [Deltaproteobacteria bacterium]